MKKLAAAALLFAAACAPAAPDPAVVPRQAADSRIEQMQVTMTELLERLDVLNDRIARMEDFRVEAAVAQPAAPPPVATSAVTPQVTAAPRTVDVSRTQVTREATARQQPRAAQQQRALIGAQIADDYRQAIILFGGAKYADARRAFQAVFEADPSGELADNALFWIGETHYVAGDYTNAIRFYTRVVNEYPEQNKAPDALFKTALAHEKTGDLALARSTLQQVIERYPFSSPASTAKSELRRIRY